MPGDLETPGSVVATVATAGTDLDPDGYTLSVSELGEHPVTVAGAVTLVEVPPGAYVVALQGLSANCAVAGENPRTVTVSGASTARTTFEVLCARVDLLAFTSSRLGGQTIWLMAHDGSDARQGSTVGLDIHLDWARDGSRFAYVSQRGASDELWLARWDGSGAVRLFVASPIRSPAWSPDGHRLAFLASTDMGPQDIWVIDEDGTGAVNVTIDDVESGNYANLRWSPDGNRLLVESSRPGSQGRDLWVLAPDGSGLTNLTDAQGWDRLGRWSPNGDRIAYVRDLTEDELWVMAADGSGASLVTVSAGAPVAPAWSPDGTRLAFVAQGDLWVVGADGQGRTNVTEGQVAVLDGEPAWSPDGSLIAFVVTRDGGVGADIWVVTPDGSALTRLTDQPGWDGDPRWRP